MNGFSLKFSGIDFSGISQGFADVPKHPAAIFAIIGLIILAIIFIKVKNIKLSTSIITNVGVALALGTVLKMIKFYQAPMGGSATLGSMVPIFIIALFYGPEIGFLTGILFGVIDFILAPYILHPVQVLFDYPLAFSAIGIAGYFRNKSKFTMLVGVLISIAVRFIFHFISGLIFYGSYAPQGMSAAYYSFFYNLGYLAPDAILCLIVLAILPLKQIFSVINKQNISTIKN
ncbi:energy-coupled thiamine transporter ThiT [Candidatus Clostridium radicumherbarum]|uniref:Energy-coupled thiamine transporter ThiT n=1 Tax=Candidatus Clostridium radicumherbarum TaxID=3381662 RepID=A0ABW8TN30_9CLOT